MEDSQEIDSCIVSFSVIEGRVVCAQYDCLTFSEGRDTGAELQKQYKHVNLIRLVGSIPMPSKP